MAERLSRRDFLRLSGIGAAGALLAACDRGGPARPAQTSGSGSSAGEGDAPRVVIVGAGLAGMTAAYRLHQAGVPARVFEARDRVGGRCWSARDFSGGQVAEHGGEFVDTRHVHMRVLVEELGLELDDLWVGVGAWVHVAELRRRRHREAQRGVPADGSGDRYDRRARRDRSARGGRRATGDRDVRRDDRGRLVRAPRRLDRHRPLSPVDPAPRRVVRARSRSSRRRQPDRLLRDRDAGRRRAVHRSRRQRSGAGAHPGRSAGRHRDVRDAARSL